MINWIDSHLTHFILLASGATGSWRGWRDLGDARASTSWPAAVGEIVGSALRVEDYHDDGEPMRRAAISYRYDVRGETYRGDRVFFGDEVALRFAGPGKRRLAAYPVGRRVAVAYDPFEPRRAVLEPGMTAATFVTCIVSAIATALGLGGLLAGH